MDWPPVANNKDQKTDNTTTQSSENENKENKSDPFVSKDEESFWRMFREDKYEKIPINIEDKKENAIIQPEILEQQAKTDSNHISSQEVINIAGSLEIDSENIINEALDENGNIKNMSEVFINYFEKKVKEKLGEKYNEDSLGDIDFDDWFWREREFVDELTQGLLEKKFKKDIDKAIVLKAILDFSTDQIGGPDEATWVSFKTIYSFTKKFKSKDISILEKALLKKAIYDLNDIYSIDSINPEADLKYIKQKVGSLKRPDFFNDKLFVHSELKFTKSQKDLIVSDNNNIDRSEFLGEEWHKYGIQNVEEVIKNEAEDFLTDFVVSKLSPTMIGVYSLKGRLIGWQRIGNLNKEGEDSLVKDFFEIKKECPLNFKEDLALFKISSSLYFRDFIQQELNIDLSKLSIENQFHFLNFIQGKTEEKMVGFKEFIRRSKNEEEKIYKMRTFLSIEQGGKEMGNKILELGEKLPENIVAEIFKGYSHLIDSAEKVRDTLSGAFENEKNTLLKKVPNQIHEALLLRAKDVLIGAHKIVMEDESKLNPDDVVKALAGITLMLDMLADLDKKELFNFTKIEETKKNLFKYRVEDKNEQAYDLKIFIRPKAEENAQARVNFELSFDTESPNKELQKAFYNKTHFVAKNKTIEGSALRIGIDRDTYGEEDLVSLDLGRSEDSGSNFDRTGDVLGKLLVFATESNIGHHTTSSFDKELADEETFSKICSRLTEYLNTSS